MTIQDFLWLKKKPKFLRDRFGNKIAYRWDGRENRWFRTQWAENLGSPPRPRAYLYPET